VNIYRKTCSGRAMKSDNGWTVYDSAHRIYAWCRLDMLRAAPWVTDCLRGCLPFLDGITKKKVGSGQLVALGIQSLT
jgi:hypothetical protein